MEDWSKIEAKDWTTRHAPIWLGWLADLVGKPQARMLEIGAAAGLSSVWFCQHVLTGEGAALDCVDCWARNLADEKKFDQRIIGLPIRKLKARSHEALPQLAVARDRYHGIYVDGSHHGEVAIFDLVVSWTLLKSGGVLIADDYDWTHRRCRIPAKLAIDGFLRCVQDSICGYELSRTGQIAIWRR